MKKTLSIRPFALFCTFVTLLCSLSACSKKNNPTPTPPFTADRSTLITQPGKVKWSVTTVTTTDGSNVVKTTDYSSNPNNDPFLLDDAKFNNDGTAVQSDFGTDITWSLSGNTLTVIFGGSTTLHATITKLDDHNMVLSFNDQLDGFAKVVCVYTR